MKYVHLRLINNSLPIHQEFKIVLLLFIWNNSKNISTESSFLDHKPESALGKMECIHVQRIPTNTKVVLVADVDKDGANEMIIGLTDRVVRSYRWSSNADLGSGKLIGLNKWECANQIGTVTLQDDSEGTPTLLVAQPGGTFMRIKCSAEDNCQLEDDDCGSEKGASCVDYQTLGISRMRNPNISTEILGNLKTKDGVPTSPEYGANKFKGKILNVLRLDFIIRLKMFDFNLIFQILTSKERRVRSLFVNSSTRQCIFKNAF